MAIWPPTLPTFNLDAQETRGDGTIRTAMDAGPAKARSRFSAVPRYLSAQIILTGEQRAAFDAFFSETLAEGSLPFDMADPKDGATVQMCFTGPPSYVYAGARGGVVTIHIVSLSLMILP